MNVATLAKLIDVHPDTVRRWAREYRQFMSPTATPTKGKTREFTAHDAAIMSFIASSRASAIERGEILDRLREMQANEWRELSEVPQEWFVSGDELIRVEQAVIESTHIAQIATLNLELQHTRAQLEQARLALENAQRRVEGLEAEIGAVRASGSEQRSELQQQLQQARLELNTARGEVETARARLQQYALGGERPLPVGAILIRAALAGALLVAAALVLARLLL